MKNTMDIRRTAETWQGLRKSGLVQYAKDHLRAAVRAQKQANMDPIVPTQAQELVRLLAIAAFGAIMEVIMEDL